MTIGPLRVDAQVILAPMAGVTDRPFRELCFRLGTRLAIAEMLAADARVWRSRKSQWRQADGPGSGLRWVQLAGADPAMLADGAARQQAMGADIIDINMGCPVKKVCNRAAGSALLRDEALVRDICERVVAAVDVPVTLKIRTGWCPRSRNAVRVAQIAEAAGIRLLSVHGRTRACRFKGQAEYATIAEVVAACSLPVVANGDIDSLETARAVLRQTGAAAVMVGRAAQGRPWLCGQIEAELRGSPAPPAPRGAELAEVIDAHLAGLHELYGEHHGVRIARKHLGWYLESAGGSKEFRQRFNTLECAAAQRDLVKRYFNRVMEHEAKAA